MGKPKKCISYKVYDHDNNMTYYFKRLHKCLKFVKSLDNYGIVKYIDVVRKTYSSSESLPILVETEEYAEFPCDKSKRHVIKNKHLIKYVYKD